MTAIRIRGGTLIDGLGGPPVPNPGIEISGNRIVSIGADAAATDRAPDDDDVVTIDADGQYVMPGLIDGHVHLSLRQPIPGVFEPTSAEIAALWAASNLNRILRAGVTSISVPGGRWFADVSARDAARAGLFQGPRVYAAGPALTPYGGIFDFGNSWDEGRPDSPGVLCNSTEDFIREVRRQWKRGVDFIKIADETWGDIQAVSPENVKAATDEAHRRNLEITIHARGAGITRSAAEAGVDWIMHADLATRADLEAVAEAGVPIMPTFTGQVMWLEHQQDTHYKRGTASTASQRLARQIQTSFETIRTAFELGIPLLSGTDSGNADFWTQGHAHAREAEIMVKEIGMTSMQAIESLTRLNAVTVGLADEVGVLAAGKLADVTIWRSDPVADVTVLQDHSKLATVIRDGELIDLEPAEAA